ncbi:non-canonical purine NTP pyrophosphatase [Helicobacter sp. MIT 21-1697]|uniref:non-canonical purine NTP pyrophosphatase n=1 Tax=Helicobacter sp. MIT 21-1697 TaxID=2993733 RepID=UPI00224ABD08|nr:non-canonical purine NTP pyrophosphatase [Helicobacter sp. MIT 21-1697]MCX2716629.1 non-canonical purine NTP pyrophosphatase [Helicobacter sp. MIT 21-1697]
MTIILATSNTHKIREFQAMLGDKDAKVYAYEEILKPLHIIENGASFAENAALKAKAIYNALYMQYMQEKGQSDVLAFPLALIAEDSGICIPALGGEPGIYSARYAQYKGFRQDSRALYTQRTQSDLHITHNSTDIENLHCLLEQITPFAPTPAFFIAHIALIYMESTLLPLDKCKIEHFEGKLDGIVIGEKRGNQGFGYDPLFVPNKDNPLQKTLAQLEPSAKNMLSHRKKAISLCVERLNR